MFFPDVALFWSLVVISCAAGLRRRWARAIMIVLGCVLVCHGMFLMAAWPIASKYGIYELLSHVDGGATGGLVFVFFAGMNPLHGAILGLIEFAVGSLTVLRQIRAARSKS